MSVWTLLGAVLVLGGWPACYWLLTRVLVPAASDRECRTMTVADLRTALAEHADWQPVTIEIETEAGTALADLEGVLERGNVEHGEVTLVLQGERSDEQGRSDDHW